MPLENNYFLKQLKEEKADIILAVLNNTENQMSTQDANSLSENNGRLMPQNISSDIQWVSETSSSQQETQSLIPSSTSNGKQSLSLTSQKQTEPTKNKTEYKKNNSIQTEQLNAITNASEPDTPHSQTQSVQNTNLYNERKQRLQLLRLIIQLESLKNKSKSLRRPYGPSDQLRSIEIKTGNQVQSFGNHQSNHSQTPCRLTSKVPCPLQIAKDALKTANSRAKSVINYPSVAHNLARSPQQNQQPRQIIKQQKPKPIKDKGKTTSYARISLMNARQIYGPKARNHMRLSQPLKSVTGKLIKVSENTISQVKARTTSLERDQQVQRSNSLFNPTSNK